MRTPDAADLAVGFDLALSATTSSRLMSKPRGAQFFDNARVAILALFAQIGQHFC